LTKRATEISTVQTQKAASELEIHYILCYLTHYHLFI